MVFDWAVRVGAGVVRMDLTDRKTVSVDLAFLIALLKLAGAVYRWRMAPGCTAEESAKLETWQRVTALMDMQQLGTPMIHGLSSEEVKALLDAEREAEQGWIN